MSSVLCLLAGHSTFWLVVLLECISPHVCVNFRGNKVMGAPSGVMPMGGGEIVLLQPSLVKSPGVR